MQRHLVAAVAFTFLLTASGGADAETRFFLFVSHDVPSQPLIDAAVREAQRAGPPAAPELTRRRLSQAFPKLFDASPPGARTMVNAELKAGTAAHYATNFDQAEVHFARAFELAFADPELLDGSLVIIKRLADGAALRYANATVASKDVPEARRRFREFIRRFPSAEPTRTEHPPPVMKVWEALQAEVMARTGMLTVHVEPLDLERSGNCQLIVGGASIGRLPLAGPVALPVGEHLFQVRCGLQRSWVQRVSLAEEPLTVRVPVRAMLAARAESRSGGIVLTRPSEGDSAALVSAISEAAGFDGAVIVQTAIDAVLIGRWERGAVGPSIALKGDLTQDNITDVGGYSPDSGGGGRVWTWVLGGVGAAALLGGGIANAAYLSEQDDPSADVDTLDTLQTVSTALYVTGGVLLVTGVVLYFVEGDDEDSASSSVSAGPGGLSVAF